MADRITYADKVSVDPKPNPINQLWRYLDANEVKAVVNDHADLIESNEDDIDFIEQNIITTTKTTAAGAYTILPSDAGKFIFASDSADKTITIDTVANGAIPIGSTVYIMKSTSFRVVIDGTAVTCFGVDNGTTGNYEIELTNGVVAINHFEENEYIISGNLLLG